MRSIAGVSYHELEHLKQQSSSSWSRDGKPDNFCHVNKHDTMLFRQRAPMRGLKAQRSLKILMLVLISRGLLCYTPNEVSPLPTSSCTNGSQIAQQYELFWEQTAHCWGPSNGTNYNALLILRLVYMIMRSAACLWHANCDLYTPSHHGIQPWSPYFADILHQHVGV